MIINKSLENGDKMKKYDFLIVGSGLFGATFAYEMKNKNKKCLVIDRRSNVGGNVYCEKINEINIHKYGAHIFHTSDEFIWKYVNSFCEFNNYINSPIANYKGKIYNLPFNMNTFSKLWDISTPSEAMNEIEKQKSKIKGKEINNLEDKAISLVGLDIYEKLIKGYTEKQWGKSCKDLPSFIIERLPVRYTYDNNYFNDRYQGIPIGGYNVIIEKMLYGVDVELNVDYLSDKHRLEKQATIIIYTGMLDEYFNYCYGPLEYRSLSFENEVLRECDNYQGNAVVNYTDSETKFTRIIEHKHFEFSKCSGTVITKEYPKEWNIGDEAYYPVNNEKNNELYNKYQELAKNESNVYFGGRLADYKYYDMDDVISSAIEFSKKFN